MTKSWHELRSINDFIESCKEDAAKYRPDLSKGDKEDLAAAILSLTASDYFKKWEEQYPVLIEIEMLASDLEWSNALDVDDDWEKLIANIKDLERQVRGT